MQKTRESARIIRHKRVRDKVSGTAECPRLTVFFSNKNVSAQLIDDASGRTLATVSSLQKDIKPAVSGKPMRETAKTIGTKIGEAGKALGVSRVVFDKSGYRYGLRLRNLADAARECGLKF